MVHLHIVMVHIHMMTRLGLKLAMDHMGLVMVREPNLLILGLTDRLFMSEALQVRTTEPIALSLECGQLPTRVEPTLCRLVNVEAPAVRKVALLFLLQ